jgi:hypothetical protein
MPKLTFFSLSLQQSLFPLREIIFLTMLYFPEICVSSLSLSFNIFNLLKDCFKASVVCVRVKLLFWVGWCWCGDN